MGLFVPEGLTTTIGPDVVTVERIIDCGGPCVVKWEGTLLSFDPDGLPTGAYDNEHLAFDLKEVLVSDSEAGPFHSTGQPGWFLDRPYPAVSGEDITPLGQLPETRWRGVSVVAQFIQIRWHLCTAFSLVDWEGGGQPVAAARFDMVFG